MKPKKDETMVAHYGKLLGLEAPWEVRAAQLDLLRGRVGLEVAWAESAAVVCPECGQECARHDHAPEREWRHLNVMQFLTDLPSFRGINSINYDCKRGYFVLSLEVA